MDGEDDDDEGEPTEPNNTGDTGPKKTPSSAAAMISQPGILAGQYLTFTKRLLLFDKQSYTGL